MVTKKPINKWERFWRLTAMWISERIYVWYSEKDKYIWKEKCICDCWNVVYITRWKLRAWETKSCWCLLKDITINKNKTHWETYTRLYKIWAGIKQRCLNPSDKNYINYWWRWITLCNEWIDYNNFKNDMFDDYIKQSKIFWEKNITIDRIDVNGNYCKDNCKWATRAEQANNKRTNLFLEYKWNKYKSLMLLCKSLWIENKYETIRQKLKKWKALNLIIWNYIYGNRNKS